MLGRNRDPIYAPDGRTWYETAIDEAAKRGRLQERLELIADIAEGSRTANSLQHIAKIARAADGENLT